MASEKGFMRRLFGGIGKFLSVVRAVITGLVTVIILVYLIGLIAAFVGQRQSVEIPEGGALRIAIDGSIVDQISYVDPFSAITNSDRPNEYLLSELISAIKLAKDDDRIESMVLVLSQMQGTGISKIEELGTAIEDFKTSRKRVIAVSDSYSQQQYLLASYADEILLHSMGIVELFGLSSYQLYMADALEKLGVNIHIFRTGPHKSAVEPLIATEMSDEAREQTQRIIDDLWMTVRDGVISRRSISAEDFDTYTSSLDQLMLDRQITLAELALEFGLVDSLVTRDEMMTKLQNLAGANEEGDFYEHINPGPYLRMQQTETTDESNTGRVGLVVAKGNIYDGIEQSGSIGGDSLAYLLKQARLNDELNALVIRVDSPGGSAFASEIIRREVELFREAAIPVYISMGSVAASGGYWISAPANEIWATPTTITGSIGAFAAIPTFEDSLDKLGLNSDGVSTGPLAAALSVERPLSEQAETILQARIDNLYGQFLDLVSEGREIPLAELEDIAGGRVWTGNQALELGLVDQLGDLNEVLDAAAQAADLNEDYEVYVVRAPLSPREQVLQWLGDNLGVSISSENWLSKALVPLLAQAEQVGKELELLTDPQNMYLHCGFCSLTDEL